MITKTAVTADGDIVINTVKSPVMTFDVDYLMCLTEAHRSGIILRRLFTKGEETEVVSCDIEHNQEFIVNSDEGAYQGTLTRASVSQIVDTDNDHDDVSVCLYGICDYRKSQRSMVANIKQGTTLIHSPVYDRYLVDCKKLHATSKLRLFSDIKITYADSGYSLTTGYSSFNLKKIDRIGSVYALTLEPENTKVRFAVSFDNHETYYVFNRKSLVPIDGDVASILEKGNDRNDIGYGFRNWIPTDTTRLIDFKIVMSSSDEKVTPVFYGFQCSFYSTIEEVNLVV